LRETGAYPRAGQRRSIERSFMFLAGR
jgi:hypothetical protein